MSSIAIQAHGLSARFGARTVLDEIDLEIRAGEVTALLGPNGAGKSTLLKLLSGELDSAAPIHFFGRARHEWSPAELARHVGLLPQSSSLSFPFTAQEVVELGAIPLHASQQETRQLARHYMTQTDVVHLAERVYPALSGGEKQRLHLARVLTQLHQSGEQKVLMLDEPTSALDLAHQHNTLRIARDLARTQACAVIVVLHDLNLASQYADRLVLLHEGKLVCDAPPWQALSSDLIERVYGYHAMVAPHPQLDFPMVYPAA
ncbi:hemin ABC transporter ATP-binding protein [Vibrio furnissii]|uniref:Hemin ABC transporter ATP-binding protein n=1 Tax=Vibrio furnissii TaxID=29494 RepID=A0A0Q2Y6N3_VIBFU|nr:heme ABC transporter ATP-binding protein [Vibrio furnissii]KQH87948.1 hemin ABC transporter ATP-binding protein [Vibrio furnissii]